MAQLGSGYTLAGEGSESMRDSPARSGIGRIASDDARERKRFVSHVRDAALDCYSHNAPLSAIALSFDSLDAPAALYGLDGGKLLDGIERRLAQMLGTEHYCVRLGNKFLVVLPTTDDAHTRELARTLIDAPFEIDLDDAKTLVTANAGVATIAQWATDPEHEARSAIQCSITALHAGVRRGSGSLTVYSPSMEERLRREATIERRLATAIRRQEFFIAYQPIVEMVSKRAVGVEALVRWNHAELGRVRPHEFIPIAERMGLAQDIDQWVLARALRDLAALIEKHELTVHVNVSAAHVSLPDSADAIVRTVEATNIPSKNVVLEITESAETARVDVVRASVAQLQEKGLRVAIDDLGSGFNALSLFARVSADIVKLDRALLPEQEGDRGGIVTRGLIEICTALGVETVVEGVETESQHALALASGATCGQGYYYSLPLPASRLDSYLQRSAALTHLT